LGKRSEGRKRWWGATPQKREGETEGRKLLADDQIETILLYLKSGVGKKRAAENAIAGKRGGSVHLEGGARGSLNQLMGGERGFLQEVEGSKPSGIMKSRARTGYRGWAEL